MTGFVCGRRLIRNTVWRILHGRTEKAIWYANLCNENEKSDKDHPEQWETLADFTEDLDEALVIYQKALDKAAAINSKDHLASIAFSMAELQIELGQTDAAIKSLQNAKISANKIEDKEFKVEINELLAKLLAE